MNGGEGAGAVLAVLAVFAVLCAYDGNCCKQALFLQGQMSVKSPNGKLGYGSDGGRSITGMRRASLVLVVAQPLRPSRHMSCILNSKTPQATDRGKHDSRKHRDM